MGNRIEEERTMRLKKNAAFASVFGLAVAVLASLSMAQIASTTSLNFGDPLPGLTAAELARFVAGKTGFEQAEGVQDGLGPVFTENSCVACHSAVVGRVSVTGAGSTRLETRFGLTINGVFDPLDGTGASGFSLGGSLMQDHAIGQVGTITYVPEVVPVNPPFPVTANTVARRRTTPLFGLGLVDHVPDATLMQVAALEQASSPATAGRLSIVFDVGFGQPNRVGRFGWKCQQATLFAFAGDAYLNEMGITTPMFPNENCPQGNCWLLVNPALPPVPNDASNNTDLVPFTDFMTFLGAPPRLPLTLLARQGAELFRRIGCANCHRPALTTGPNSSAALDQVTFFPFSDFLLHDMGSLGDGIAQADAGPREIRTAPLWGVRLQATLLHDGRATSIPQAILEHRGQAQAARDAFADLGDRRQAALVAFLKSL
jgi:CxxC motif-containing protein (DUF1111 family)